MNDDQFIFSSSWLPSPRIELRTLAGYTTLRVQRSSSVVAIFKLTTLFNVCEKCEQNLGYPLNSTEVGQWKPALIYHEKCLQGFLNVPLSTTARAKTTTNIIVFLARS
jgi:hypothetical protein